MGFTHLQVRSAYSLLNSSIKLADYVSLATSNRLKSLALVEEGSMHSAIKFYIACQKAGIKPIIGMSLKIRGEGFEDEWTLLAKNSKGYETLLTVDNFNTILLKEELAILIDIVILLKDTDVVDEIMDNGLPKNMPGYETLVSKLTKAEQQLLIDHIVDLKTLYFGLPAGYNFALNMNEVKKLINVYTDEVTGTKYKIKVSNAQVLLEEIL